MARLSGRLSRAETALRPPPKPRPIRFVLFENGPENPDRYSGDGGQQYSEDEIDEYVRAHQDHHVVQIHKDYGPVDTDVSDDD